MLKKVYNSIKKQYRKVRVFTQPHPIYSTIDRIKLSKIERDNPKKGFLKLHLKGLGHPIKIRKNFIDKEVVGYVFADKYHLPPQKATLSDNPIILDLGSNIGLTVVHLKQLYPKSTIYGYEMNTNNYLLAKNNTKFYKNVHIHNQAIWKENTTVSYNADSDFDAYSIKENDDFGKKVTIQSTTIQSIIETYNLTHIDYVKMDIEGAEEAILEQDDLRWLQYVKAINIEMHLDESEDINTYINILKAQGFNAWKDDKHWSSIMAVKNH